MITSSLIIYLFLPVIRSVTVNTINKCNFPIWVGAFGVQFIPDEGGWKLDPDQEKAINIPISDQWSGRFWGRTDCEENSGRCSTGSCGGTGIECKGTTGEPPATLAEITVNGGGDKDYYDISLVDGFNLPLKIRPIIPSFCKYEGEKYDCAETGCDKDLNQICPPQLSVKKNDKVIACRSACAAFNTDEYCCRGDHGQPLTCPPNDYSKIFKEACPNAYSYAYDDSTSTFTCKTGANYEIQFC